MEIVYTDEANQDLVDTFGFIAVNSDKIAFSQVKKIKDNIKILKEMPCFGRVIERRGKKTRFRRLVVKPYIVIYEVLEKREVVRIICAIDGRRDYMKILFGRIKEEED